MLADWGHAIGHGGSHIATQTVQGEQHNDTFLTPPVAGALLRAAFVASCLRGALPPVDLRAVCLVRAMTRAAVANSTTQAGRWALEDRGCDGKVQSLLNDVRGPLKQGVYNQT